MSDIKKIAISDPASMANVDAVKYLIYELRRTFPSASIKIIFHRGWKKDRYSSSVLVKRQTKLVNWAEGEGIPSIDISYGWEGFQEYDDCDIHVGYRVHAHLYNVSHRKPSFLIEEDGRGYGANDALGRKTHVCIARNSISARKLSAVFSRLGIDWCPKNESHAITATEMVDYVMREVVDGYPENETSCYVANETFNIMRKQLESAASLLGEV